MRYIVVCGIRQPCWLVVDLAEPKPHVIAERFKYEDAVLACRAANEGTFTMERIAAGAV